MLCECDFYRNLNENCNIITIPMTIISFHKKKGFI